MLIFEPPYSRMGMGIVRLAKRPDGPVTPPAYRMLLARRIQEMVDDADPDEAKAILRELGMQEGVMLSRDLSQAGELLAEHSQTLRELAAYPVEPIPPEAFQHDGEMLDAIAEENLEEFVMRLLR
jgi:hypothetical protein